MNWEGHVFNAVAPHADMYETGPIYSDIVDPQGSGVLFIIQQGIGTTGTTTVTVDACSTITATATTAIPFIYRVCLGTSPDTWSAWTAGTTFGTTAGSNNMFQIWVDPAEIAETGYKYVRLVMTELVDAVVIGGVIGIVMDPRYQVQPTSLLD